MSIEKNLRMIWIELICRNSHDSRERICSAEIRKPYTNMMRLKYDAHMEQHAFLVSAISAFGNVSGSRRYLLLLACQA